MSNQIVQTQIKDVCDFLDDSVSSMSDYLDHNPISKLLSEEGSKKESYYRQLLKALRRLEVFCSEALDASKAQMRADMFNKSTAEKTLHGIYHQCIMEFYSPKNDIWYEDSRAAYTGKNAIHYHDEPPQSFKNFIASLEKPFQDIREELEYYETDYSTKVAMKNNQE